jgi:hypothetical protein
MTERGSLKAWIAKNKPGVVPGSKRGGGQPQVSFAEWRAQQNNPTYSEPGDSNAERTAKWFAWKSERSRTRGGSVPWRKYKELMRRLRYGALAETIQDDR